MSLTYPCPKCGGLLQVDNALAGRILKCARCRQKIAAANPLTVVGQAPEPFDNLIPVPPPRPSSPEFLELRAEKRERKKVAGHSDFLLRFMVFGFGLALVAGLVLGAWKLIEYFTLQLEG